MLLKRKLFMKGIELVEGSRGRRGESFIGSRSTEEIIESLPPELREKLNKNIEKIKEIEKNHQDTISKIDQNLKKKKEAIELRADRLEKAAKLKAKKVRARNAKIGAGVAAGTVAIGTGVYLAKKHHDKKNKKD